MATSSLHTCVDVCSRLALTLRRLHSTGSFRLWCFSLTFNGERKLIRVEIDMNNSAGVFQVDNLLAAKLRGSGLEDHIEVVARIESEHEKRLLRVFEI